jgi:hypothetical protein
MSDPKIPDGFELVGPKAGIPEGFELVDGPDTGAPGSPLDSALKSQTGDVVSVDTPGGAAQFTRDGRRVLSPDEQKTALDAGDARAKTAMGTRALSMINSAGMNIAPYAAGAVGAAKSIGTRESLVDAFRRNKDSAQSTVDAADKESGLGWQIAGKVPSMLVGGPATAVGRVALGAGLAGTEAFTRSRGTLGTPEGRAQVAEDTAKGAGIGALASGVGEVLSKPFAAAANRLGASSAANASRVSAEELGGMSPTTSSQVDQAVAAADKAFANPYASAASRTAAQQGAQTAQQGLAATTAAQTNAAARLAPVNVLGNLGKLLAPRAALAGVGYLAGQGTGIEHGGIGGALAGAALGGQGAAGVIKSALGNPATASVLQGAGAAVSGGAVSAIRGAAQVGGQAKAAHFSKPKDQRTEEAVQALLDSGF